jgi:1-acyl-sn-glycerol-3-phosphate acyltransferase
MLQFLRLIRLEVVGDEQLRASRGALIVANHPSLLDVVLLMAQVPNAQCIVKHQLWNHPLLGGLVRRAGYIRNDLDGETMIDECRKSLQSGHNIIVFPEGTRSCPDGLQRLQRGFANIAILTGAKIQLVLITCTPSMLTKGVAWWMVPDRRSLFRLVVGRELNATAYLDSNNRSLASRRLTEHVETYYMEKLSHA